MSAHTPSPWSFVQSGTGDFPIWNVRIGTRGLITLPATAGMETMDADARLIAAAPELLEACKLIVSVFDALPPTSAARYERLQINAARAAIAKAEGEAT